MKLFCFMGASGTGKSSIQHSLNLSFLTHFTTREARIEEVEGYHIHHIERGAFEYFYKVGDIATRTEYAGNLYGAPRHTLENIKNLGKPYHATATIESIRQFKEILGDENVIVFYIKAPSIEELRKRMESRGDSQESIDKRIAHIESAAELENETYADHVIINENLEDSVKRVESIITTYLTNFAN